MAGIGNAARHGVLIKGGEHLEKIGRIQTLVLDKTGTLTVGQPELVGLWALDGNEEELLRLAGAVEKLSEHPLAKPVAAAAAQKGQLPQVSSFKVLAGRGVVGVVKGQRMTVGTPRLMVEEGIKIPLPVLKRLDQEEARGRTAVLVAKDDNIIGALFLADRPRPEAYQLVDQLKQNVVFAVLVVLVLLIGVLGQKVVLASGMLVHEASVLMVILNAMRLLRYRLPKHQKN